MVLMISGRVCTGSTVKCSSKNRKDKTCSLKGDEIKRFIKVYKERVFLVKAKQISKSRCEDRKTYQLVQKRGRAAIKVKKGCRAEFKICANARELI